MVWRKGALVALWSGCMTRGMQFAELSTFVAVAEEASFTKAAKRLGMSRASLSQAVRGLEEDLGVRLLNRTTRSVAVTDAGQRMLAQLRPLLDGFDAALESVNAFRDKPAGHLRLVTTPGAAKSVLAPVLAKFVAQYPEISVEVVVGTGKSDLVANHFDAGIHRGELVGRDMIAVRITHDYRFVTVASPDYLARHGRPQTPSDLSNHDCIRVRLSGGEIMPWRYVVNDETIEFETHGCIISNDLDLAVSTALEGVGLLYMIEEYVAPMMADGRLVCLLSDFAPANSGLFLFYPSRRQNPAALRALIDFMRRDVQGAAPEKKQLPPVKCPETI
jgi:DNA-binding transcriptional LysR family regulator